MKELELEALLPALEKAFADLESEVSRYRGNYRGAQTEIAALRETMACTHPKACWKERDSKLSKGPMGTEYREGYCTACEHERLAVARHDELMTCGHPRACWQATKPDSVDAVVGYRCVACEALDAHDADTRNRALEEAAIAAHQCPGRCHAKDDIDFHSGGVQMREAIEAAIRALKREKRGGE